MVEDLSIGKEIPLEDDIFTGDKMYKSGKCMKEIWENIWEILKNNCRKEKVYLFKGINKRVWKLWLNKRDINVKGIRENYKENL